MCLNPGDILRDRYRIIDELGEGGFARTYTAKDLVSPENPLCVVKEIGSPQSSDLRVLEEAQQQFKNEVNSLKLLDKCPHIPALINSFIENKKFYLIQEYIEGNPLNKEVVSLRQFQESEVIDLLLDILSVLDFVHSQGIIHRDIKPSNLIRRQLDGKIVLIDFGAVKGISNLAIEGGKITQTRAIGTEGYMPAEQWKNQPRVNSDIYAVGIIGIQAIAGLDIEDLFYDKKTGELVWHYSTDDRPMVQISDKLEKVLNKMVRYHFNDRYQSAAEVLQDLRSLTALHSPAPHAQQHLLPKPQRQWKDKLRVCLPIAIAGFFGVAAFLIHKIFTPKTCPLIQGDAASCGEELLIKTSSSLLKERGINNFFKENYQSAFNSFQQSWNEEERKDPETLIYMNNALLKAKKADYYTLAVAVPISNSEGGTVNSDLAREMLRGIAQAQTEVNLGLFNSDRNKDFPGQGFLAGKAINGKGIRVIIADDANLKTEAKARASSLVKQTEILGVVGHYTSEMTVHAVDIYDKNRLVLISPGSTTEQLTEKRRNFFFRTVPRHQITAKNFKNYLIENAGSKKAAGLYCPEIQATSSLWEEFRKQFRQAGGNIVSITEYDLCKKNFNVELALQEIERTEKTAIVLSTSHVPNAVKNAMALIKANGDRNWVVGTGGIYSQKTLETASQLKSFEKLVTSSSWHPLTAPNRTFADNARKLWGGNVNHRTALTYDATLTLIKAIEIQEQPSREGMQKTIASLNFSATGATGTIEFDANGDRQNFRPELVHIVKCQKEQFGVAFVPVKYATAAAAGLKCD
ncbi:bifunctional serine/threonine-protein kinase/ABC transporter substrate-binding protein [Tychonema sp. LEGE 07203]|uniref:bifunctional serine/threonine-protein kinase/ABC transporter substrate-binding protein n=1 Tax=Tychonema sp. LEGE 07203 TaxID=1828671 RepID=UPI00187FA588|nr:bifunctional serine/threonine-protein kinase/ABC transporter substrate-binding protein [Tychonema sp. LEGE 07203]MBE9093978.1 ABC transporter substrate-binding protein [Tychonema sp. LEGE 07203]